MGSWIDQELEGCSFADKGLGKRFGVLIGERLVKCIWSWRGAGRDDVPA